MFHRRVWPRCSDAIILALCQCYVRARPSFASALSPSAANNPETQEPQESERAHHAIARDTEVVLKLRQKATFIFRITSAHPLTLKWGAVRVHAHPHADHQSPPPAERTDHSDTRHKRQGTAHTMPANARQRQNSCRSLSHSSFRAGHPPDDLSCSSAAAIAEDFVRAQALR